MYIIYTLLNHFLSDFAEEEEHVFNYLLAEKIIRSDYRLTLFTSDDSQTSLLP
ncbi:MAG: hypothetical protein RIC03_13380 [Cyclobacteriaceae bacterium]